MGGSQLLNSPTESKTMMTPSRAWWKSAIVYQIYPSSFCDANGDGIGDLKGITSKLDYLRDLGVDAIWISPIHQSPNKDMGYDISDYQDIDPRYGTLEDFDEMTKGIHDRGMKLIMDLVINHSSDMHQWFKESSSSLDNPKRDWYIWRKPDFDKDGKPLPINNWQAAFGGSAWQYDEKTGESYLHLYLPEQPDLNWANPEVRKALFDMMEWWISRGVDGFRMDVINLISKPDGLPDADIKDPDHYFQRCWHLTANGPHVHEYLREMNEKVLSKHGSFTVGECPFDVTPSVLSKYVASERKELQMVFQFEGVYFDTGKSLFDPIPFDLPKFKQIQDKWQHCLVPDDGWNSLYLENHDCPRSIARFASESPEYRTSSAALLAIHNSTLSGTQFVYQGEELAMINMPRSWPIEEYKDVATQNYYHEELEERREKSGKQDPDMTDIMDGLRLRARDHARTPMQWSDKANAGFSPEGAKAPWMRVHDDYKQWNAAAQENDSESALKFYTRLLAIKKKHPIFTYGDFTLLSPDHKQIFSYIRRLEGKELLVLLNFSGETISYDLPEEAQAFKGSKLLICNVSDHADNLTDKSVKLEPYEGCIYMKA